MSSIRGVGSKLALSSNRHPHQFIIGIRITVVALAIDTVYHVYLINLTRDLWAAVEWFGHLFTAAGLLWSTVALVIHGRRNMSGSSPRSVRRQGQFTEP